MPQAVLRMKATLLWEEMLPLPRGQAISELAMIWVGSEETKPLPPIPISFLDYHGSYAVYCVSHWLVIEYSAPVCSQCLL